MINSSYIPGFSNALTRSTGAFNNPLARGLTEPELYEDLYGGAAGLAAAASGGASMAAQRAAAGLIRPQYSPELQAYLDEVNGYAASQEAPFGSFSSGIQLSKSIAGPGFSLNQYYDPSELQSYIGQPVENNVKYNFNVPVDSGSKSGDVSVGYNTPVYLINPKTGELYAGGVGFDAAKQVANKARELSVGQRNKANWEIYTGPAGATDFSQFTRSAVDDPNKGFLGTLGDIAKFALPIGLQFIPGLGTALGASLGLSGLGATAVGTGLTAALGRTAGGVVAGDSVLSSLKAGLTTGALSGLTAGALQGAGVLGGGLGSSAAGQGVNQSLSGAAANAASGAGNLASGVAGGLGNEIVVNGIKTGLGSALGGAIGSAGGAIGGAILNGSQSIANQAGNLGNNGQEPITVTANTAPNVATGGLGALTGSVAPNIVNGIDQATGEIVAEGNKPTQNVADNLTVPPLSGFNGEVPMGQTPELQTEVDSGLDTLDKLRLALLAAGMLGGGGSQQTSGGTIPAGLNGGLNSVFTSQLPTANLPPATPRTTSDMGDVDYYRYGYGPAQSFFSNVPQGAKNTSQAYTGYAKGGSTGHAEDTAPRSSFAVGGRGDGRSDEIPAMLSDGEYIIDAETVALLGNGSNKAGAQALDKFRVNVRKHKGRPLAKGKFSVDARRPEQYLKGRK